MKTHSLDKLTHLDLKALELGLVLLHEVSLCHINLLIENKITSNVIETHIKELMKLENLTGNQRSCTYMHDLEDKIGEVQDKFLMDI